MVDKETQVNVFEGIREALGRCRKVLASMDVEGNKTAMYSLQEAQRKKLCQLRKLFDIMKASTSKMNASITQVSAKLKKKDEEERNLQAEYLEIKAEFERLVRENETLQSQPLGEIYKETEEELAQRTLLEFTREDAAQKRKDLETLKTKSSRLDMELQDEWKALKSDVFRFRREKRYFEQQIQNIHNMALFKIRELLRMKSNSADQTEKQHLDRVISYLQIQRQIRDIQEEMLDLSTLSCELENEIAELRAMRRHLMGRNDAMETQRHRLRTRWEECGYQLHRTPRHTDLPNRDLFRPKSAPGTEMEIMTSIKHGGGYRLHRCQRNTNISLPSDMIDDVDRNLLLGMREESAEESPDMSSDMEDFPGKYDNCGLELHRCQKRMNIALPPELLDEGERALLMGLVQSDHETESLSETSGQASDDDVISADIDHEEQGRESDKDGDDVGSDDDVNESPSHEGGTELHRCNRSMHIALPPSLVEEMDRLLVLGLLDVEDRNVISDSESATSATSEEAPEQNGEEEEDEAVTRRTCINPASNGFEGNGVPGNQMSILEKIRGRLSGAIAGTSASISGVTRRALTAGSGLGKQSSERKMENPVSGRGGRRGRR